MGENYELNAKVFGRTDVGTVRDHNEDNFLVANLTTGASGLRPEIRNHDIGYMGSLFLVCDGMGGAAAGEVASALAVEAIHEKMAVQTEFIDRHDLARKLLDSILYANEVILQSALKNREQKGMGTTCTAATLLDDILLLGQVGDSRAYVIRNKKLYQVTQDQTLVNKLMELGQLNAEDAEKYEHSHVILQALGVREKVKPVLSLVELLPGDALLVCSDGLNDALKDPEILDVINSDPNGDPVQICKSLTDTACAHGANDNITVIYVKFGGFGYGFGDLTQGVPYLKVPPEEYDSNILLIRSPPGNSETTQVFGSFNLRDIQNNKQE
jgi:PPM family protein phosphatase